MENSQLMGTFLSDVRYALRQMRLTPVFTVTVMLTLGLGIGATTAIFSLIHTVMLKSLPVADPARLYRIGTGSTCCVRSAPQGDWGIFSYAFYQRMQPAAPQFDQIAAFQAIAGELSIRRGTPGSQAQALLGEYVSGNYFQTFGILPFAGRLFTADDDRTSAAPAAVMSYRTWQQEFGGDAAIVGSTLVIENHLFTVVGIAPPGFFGETLSTTPPSLWIPLQTELLIDGKDAFNLMPSKAWLRLIGHLRPGATTDGVAARLTSVLQHWLPAESATMPEYLSGLDFSKQRIGIEPAGSGIGAMKAAYGDSLRILFGICAMVLLIACANIANLLLARGMNRRAQVAIRAALGASRQRIIRQSLTESILLAVLGGICGIVLAVLGAHFAAALAFGRAEAAAIDVSLSWPVLGFCFASSLVTGIVFGTFPAWLTSHAEPIEAVRGIRTVSNRSALPQKIFVVVQATISVVLIAVASMLTHSLLNMERQDLGFDPQNRISVLMNQPLADYTFEQLNTRYRDLLYRLSHLPGVRGASLAVNGPLVDSWKEDIVKPGEGMPKADGLQVAHWDRISPGYFQTIGQSILQGRDIAESDDVHSRNVAVVNQAFVHRFYPNENPIGRHFGFDLPANSSTFEIVGVVRDAKYGDPSQPVMPMVFAPLEQQIGNAEEQTSLQEHDKWSHFISSAQIWVSGDMGHMEPLIREAFKEAEPNFAIANIQPMQQQVAAKFEQQRAVAQLSSMFGVIALLLASIGLYGVTAYTVTRRTGEIGVRMALGANRFQIMRLILREAFLQLAVGITLGIPASILVGKLLTARLYQVGTIDPIALMTAVAGLLFCAFVASIFPSRRAASIEPVRALRME